MGRARDRASADLNGQEFILDADADTSISADTDDQIDIKIAGADDFQFTANTFTAQSGSTIAAQALTATTITATGDVSLDGGSFVFNESSADKDFRVESNGNANMINVDGGNDRVGIGISPSFNVQIDKSSTNTTLTDLTDAQLVLSNTGTATTNQHVKLGFRFQDGSYNGQAMIAAVRESSSARSASLRFYSAPSSDGDPDEAIAIDSNGHVTMPKQSAFLVSPSTEQNNLTHDQTMTFDTEIYDQNADFSSNTFTAPVTGRYLMCVAVEVDSVDTSAGFVRVEMATSNRAYSNSLVDPGGLDTNDYMSFDYSIIVDMDANDTCFLRWGQSGGSNVADLSSRSFWSGALIC